MSVSQNTHAKPNRPNCHALGCRASGLLFCSCFSKQEQRDRERWRAVREPGAPLPRQAAPIHVFSFRREQTWQGAGDEARLWQPQPPGDRAELNPELHRHREKGRACPTLTVTQGPRGERTRPCWGEASRAVGQERGHSTQGGCLAFPYCRPSERVAQRETMFIFRF